MVSRGLEEVTVSYPALFRTNFNEERTAESSSEIRIIHTFITRHCEGEDRSNPENQQHGLLRYARNDVYYSLKSTKKITHIFFRIIHL